MRDEHDGNCGKIDERAEQVRDSGLPLESRWRLNHFEESAYVNAPVGLCYQCWRNFACLPSFFHNVEHVEDLGEGIWRWHLLGAHDDESFWDLLLAQDIPNRLISWRTVSGPGLVMAVDIQFDKIDPDRTAIRLALSVNGPESPAAEVAENLHGITSREIHQNLAAFKQVVEGLMLEAGANDFYGKRSSSRESAGVFEPSPKSSLTS